MKPTVSCAGCGADTIDGCVCEAGFIPEQVNPIEISRSFYGLTQAEAAKALDMSLEAYCDRIAISRNFREGTVIRLTKQFETFAKQKASS